MSKIKQQSTIKDMLLATIEEQIDAQNAKGLKKYGESLDDCAADDYDWNKMALEEAIDLMQYQLKELRRLEGYIVRLDDHVEDLEHTLEVKKKQYDDLMKDYRDLQSRNAKAKPLYIDGSGVSKILTDAINRTSTELEEYINSSASIPDQSPGEALDSAVKEYRAVSEQYQRGLKRND